MQINAHRLKIPDVYQHVTNMGLPWAVITTKWFICLFAEVLPTEVNNLKKLKDFLIN